MARRLNIERRRKRIRHYRAQRRRRSPAWRALLFWWAPALIVAVAALALAQAVAAFVGRPGAGPAARYALPRPSLGLVAATAAQAEELRRLGNVRRLAGALGDADIGISLAPRLPEPDPLPLGPLGALPRPRAAGRGVGAAALPPAAEALAAAPAPREARVRPSAALAEAGFRARLPRPEGRGRCVFWVELDAAGRVATAARFEPAGAETPALRQVRDALLAGRGRGAAQGFVTVAWDEAGKEDGR